MLSTGLFDLHNNLKSIIPISKKSYKIYPNMKMLGSYWIKIINFQILTISGNAMHAIDCLPVYDWLHDIKKKSLQVRNLNPNTEKSIETNVTVTLQKLLYIHIHIYINIGMPI